MRTLVALSLAVLALGGCASTALRVNLDLYRDDTRGLLVELTPARVAQLTVSLATAGPEVDSLARDRADLADSLVNTYEAVYKMTVAMVGRAYDPSNRTIATAREYLDDYKRAVEKQRSETQVKLTTASQKLEAYATRRDTGGAGSQRAEREALQAISEAARAMPKMGGSLGTDFEKSLVAHWDVMIKSVSIDNLRTFGAGAAGTEALRGVRSTVTALGQQLEQLRQRGRRVPRDVTRVLAGALKDSQLPPGRLKTSLDQVAKAMTAVPVSLSLDDRGAAALHDLALSATLLFSQIDRLQDPADPVWRLITAPDNEPRWNTTFSETYFYSEGNNSVVVVRDTPFSFRVQRGTNNPAALIQGQLQISRAIANAAIAVAGAASGVPVPKLPGAGDAAKPAAADDTGTEAEHIAKRRAKVERQTALRAGAIVGLRRQLGALRGQLERTDQADQPGIDALLSQIQSVLEGYETALAPTK